MSHASSSDVPLPPNGGGAPSPLSCPVLFSLADPSLPLCLAMGRARMIWGVPSPPLQKALQEGHVFLLGGCPPPSPLPLLQALYKERAFLLRG